MRATAKSELEKYIQHCQTVVTDFDVGPNAEMDTAMKDGQEKLSTHHQSEWWEAHKRRYPLLYAAWHHVGAHLMSSAQSERDFGAAALVLPFNRNALGDAFFEAQLIACLQWAELIDPEDMPLTSMQFDEVMRQMPGEGFGIPQFYAEWDEVATVDDTAEGDGVDMDGTSVAECTTWFGDVWAEESE